MKRLLVAIAALFLILACGANSRTTTQPSVETIVAGTIQAFTASAPPPDGARVSFENISFEIPEGLAEEAGSEIIARSPAGDDVPTWDVYPEHIRFTLLQSDLFPSQFEPMIRIFPAQEYASMNDSAQQLIPMLEQKLASGDYAGAIVLPPYNAALTLDAQAGKLDFVSGSGIRSIQEYHQAPVPITNDFLIYSFQGVIGDTKYYVSAVIPIHAPFLIDETYNPAPYSTTPTPVVPPGGFAFPLTTSDNPQDYSTYIQSISAKLSQLPTDQFSPSLAQLDTLVQSIQIISE